MIASSRSHRSATSTPSPTTGEAGRGAPDYFQPWTDPPEKTPRRRDPEPPETRSPAPPRAARSGQTGPFLPESPSETSSLGATIPLVDTLVALLEHRHPFFRGGSTLVRLIAEAIAWQLGLREKDRHRIALTALLRDLGRIGLGENELEKPPAEMSSDDRQRIESHIEVGLGLFDGIQLPPEVRAGIRSHHERWDGEGYPDGLVAEDIPLPARIVAVADSFVAMIQPRAYRPSRGVPAAMEELRQGAGTRYDPVVVAAAERALCDGPHSRLGFSLRQHVLVLHPEGSEGTALVARLGAYGYLVELADSVEHARKRLDRAPFEAILVMSEPDGRAACHGITELRVEPRLEGVPAVAVGADLPSVRVALLEAGAEVALPSDVAFEELRGTLAALLARSGQTSRTGDLKDGEPWHKLEGELRDFPLAWLLQALQYDGRSGLVHVEGADGRIGLVEVEQGVPRHARSQELTGEEALRELLRWRSGRFRVEPDLPAGEATIDTPLIHILLDEAVAEDRTSAFGTVLASA